MGNMKLGPIPFNVCHSQQETCDLPVVLIVFSSVFDGILIVKALLGKGEGPIF